MRTKILALALALALTDACAAQDTPNLPSPAAQAAAGSVTSLPLGYGLITQGTAASPSEAEAAAVAAIAAATAPAAETPDAPATVQSKAGRLLRASEELIMHALNLVGVRYRYGGADPESGLDCSGFVQHVFKQAIGLALPHNAYSISLQGRRIPQSDLKPGDVVFFNTLKRAYSHIGIYIGDNRFIHAGRMNQQIEVAQFDKYWIKRFDGARRLIEHPEEK